MRELYEIKGKINEMREMLYQVINKKQNLLDDEVIITSQQLDNILNEYNALVREL